jgi:DNA-binding LacI/PurR family transcriptional regulator
MTVLKTLSITAQVAAYMREGIQTGRWQGRMPGRDHLAAELGASPRTVQGALEMLEKEGLLQRQGVGRQRLITMKESPRPTAMRVRILPYEENTMKIDYIVDLRHQLEEAGHHAAFAEKSLQDLGMDPQRVERLVKQTPADAWVVVSGSREVLTWFASQPVPVFALFGRLKEVPLAGVGPKKSVVVQEVVRHLVELGHRRIVMMSREDRRKPEPGFVERLFLEELEKLGIQTGRYNLPDWGNTKEEFHTGLENLFKISPPTALILPYPTLFVAAEKHLALRGIVAPKDISMVCLDPDPIFAWCQPEVSHIHWDSGPLVKSVMRWMENISRGQEDRRNLGTPAKFIEGGTIGPVPKESTRFSNAGQTCG